ncbi:hypothetical protein LMH87_000013 [Akanthomyces muscarius]|uniref:Uncharacterized protein n=1 Tax=Akanthomyces muscarius TaxID=2231603 RepID=A0A9W8QEM6_AKAMU|nr:hypothetical protein LMH87_000013 [Akanthomyces muscarius]KAJ4154734.1 hypothetical protein LMH87_000013 [Akanthomyces muscarius]
MDATFVIAIGKRNMSAGSILPPFIVQVLSEIPTQSSFDRSKPERSLNCVRRPKRRQQQNDLTRLGTGFRTF